ncbi:J domain-containing protein [Sphingomicrobium flavum]|uniref:J domain-containing protein n=1 Tax=Sphingomicrobium flavum TaxID=1229164 RepID=UPI0021AE1FCD|nr:J domain-containing protein [Sphingomicrobium flavum]
MGRKAYEGRIEDADSECAAPGCRELGEYRAPLTPSGPDGPGVYRLLCLDHVREHNAAYDFFAGMSADEILEAQSPIPRHGIRARQFAFQPVGDPPPTWADFDDPLDAIAARFRNGASMKAARAASRFSGAEQHALEVLGLDGQAELSDVRKRYSALVRQYHPDRNGGDRSFEVRLTRVIEAWQTLRKARAFL